MCNMIACLVDRDAKVHAKNGVHSHSKIAKICRVNEDKCLRYEYRLATRRLFQDFTIDEAPFWPKQSHDQAAQRFFDGCAGTPEKLIAYVKKGNWDEEALPDLLTGLASVKFDEVCADAEAKYEKVCNVAEAKYEKVCDAAEAKFDKARAAAEAKRCKARAAAEAKLCKARTTTEAQFDKAFDAAQAQFNKACNAAEAKRDKACDAAEAKCDKARATAEVQFNKVSIPIWIKLFRDPANRIKIWQK